MEYSDTDDGMLLVTVCETDEGEGACQYQNESSTSVEYMLIPHAFPEIVVCDDMGCELPNRLAGTRSTPKDWYHCSYDSDSQKDVTEIWSFTPKNFEITIKSHDSSDSTCSGRLLYLHELQGSAKQNSASAFVYPTISFIDDETGDNLSVYEIKINISSNKRTLLDDGMINSYNSNKTCGYNANDWADNVSMNVGGCNEITPSIDVGLDHSIIIYSSDNNSSIRIGHSDSDNNTGYPRDLGCWEYSNDMNNPGGTNLCKSSSGSSSGGSLYFDNATSTFFDNQRNLAFTWPSSSKSENKYSYIVEYCSGPEELANENQLRNYSFGPGSLDSNFHALLQSNSYYVNDPQGKIWVMSTDNSSNWSGNKPVYNFATDNITYEDNNMMYFGICVRSTDNSST